jgi:hypothetical protein
MTMPSPRTVPSASSENGRQSPLGERALVLLKPVNMTGSFNVSTPPTRTVSACPRASSLTALWTAASELAHAASVT